MFTSKNLFKISRNFLFYCLFGISFSAQSAKLDFESPREGVTIAEIQELVLYAFTDSEPFAHRLAKELNSQSLIGWPGGWMLQLNSLDLIGYYFSLEKAQYYSSAGKWTPPKHKNQILHLDFYQQKINPDSAPYSLGLSHETIYKFAKVFLQDLLIQNSDLGLQTIKILAQSGREFWLNHIVWSVFPSPLVDDKFIGELIEIFELEASYLGTYDTPIRTIVEGLLLRGKANPRSKVRQLMAILYGRAQLRGEMAIINPEVIKLSNGVLDCSILLEVDAAYKSTGVSFLEAKQ